MAARCGARGGAGPGRDRRGCERGAAAHLSREGVHSGGGRGADARLPEVDPGRARPDGSDHGPRRSQVLPRRRPVAWKRVPTDMWSFTCDVPEGTGPLDVAFDYVTPLTSQTTASAQLMILNWWSVVLYPQGPDDNRRRSRRRCGCRPAGSSARRCPSRASPATRSRSRPSRSYDSSTRRCSRRPLEDGRLDAGREARPLAPPRRRQRGGGRDLAGRRRALPAPGRRGRRALRRAPLRQLPLAPHPLRPRPVERPRAPRVERQPRRRALRSLDDGRAAEVLGSACSRTSTSTPGTASTAGRRASSRSSRTTSAPMRQPPALGLRGADRVLGDVLAGAQRAGGRRSCYRENAGDRRRPDGRAGGTHLAPARGHRRRRRSCSTGARPDWADWRRGVDYYPESELIWLEADTIIRQKSGGRKSLDDFAKAFHGSARRSARRQAVRASTTSSRR